MSDQLICSRERLPVTRLGIQSVTGAPRVVSQDAHRFAPSVSDLPLNDRILSVIKHMQKKYWTILTAIGII